MSEEIAPFQVELPEAGVRGPLTLPLGLCGSGERVRAEQPARSTDLGLLLQLVVKDLQHIGAGQEGEDAGCHPGRARGHD